MRILMTGGTGLIGRALCAALLKAGHELTVLSRHPDTVKRKCGAQVTPLASLNQWDDDTVFDAVINLAGEPIVDARWTASRKKVLWDSRITLTQKLVERMAACKHTPGVLLSGSAIGFYGDRQEESLNESAQSGHDFAAELCVAWESAAMRATQSGVRVCYLRTGLVLAPDGGLLSQMLPPFKLGLGARLGGGQQWMSWIHIDDYVASAMMILDNPAAVGAINMTAPQPVTNRDFTRRLAAALKRPAPWVAPGWLLKCVLAERAALVLGGQRVLPSKLESLQYRFVYPALDDALPQLIQQSH